MDVKTYTGNNSTQTIPLNFNPDFIWLKCRNSARSHRLIDTVRGLNYQLWSDLTTGGNTYDATSYVSSVTSTSSSGFVVDNSGSDQYNTSGETYAAWCWDAGTTTVSNTQGSITGGAQVRANPTAGFSVVTYTGNAISTATVGHGLGVSPSLIITKSRSNSSNWGVYHSSIGPTQYLLLNSTSAAQTSSSPWNNTAPTSTVFSIGDASFTNTSGDTYVGYAFAPVVGYSSFGSYTGNGSTDGPFIYTGFRPRWIMIKGTTNTYRWMIIDTTRSTYNQVDNALAANYSDAESTSSGNFGTDILSNGFKPRTSGSYTSNSNNGSGDTFVYAAFAEAPLNYSRAR
jgi:hypothetical protein